MQLPVLTAGLDISAGQASAPIAIVQITVQPERQFQFRTLQIEGEFLVLDIALAAGGQRAQRGVAGLDAAAFEVDFRPLRAIEGRVQVQALQAIVFESQLRALQPELALRCLERAGDINATVELSAQLRPELGQTWKLDVDLPGELLLQTALAGDAVVTEADLQRVEVPLFTAAVGLGLDHRRLAAQFAFEVEVGVQAEFFILHLAFATQRSGQRTR